MKMMNAKILFPMLMISEECPIMPTIDPDENSPVQIVSAMQFMRHAKKKEAEICICVLREPQTTQIIKHRLNNEHQHNLKNM